jgi:hypothetical protein
LADPDPAQGFRTCKILDPAGVWRFVNHRAWCFAHNASFST